MFSSYSTNKKFLSLLALSHAFLFFIWECVLFLLLATCPGDMAKFPETLKEMWSYPLELYLSLHKIFTRDSKCLTLQKAHITHKYFPLGTRSSFPPILWPRFYMRSHGTNSSVPQEPQIHVASSSLSGTQEVIFVLSLVHTLLERVISGFDPQ